MQRRIREEYGEQQIMGNLGVQLHALGHEIPQRHLFLQHDDRPDMLFRQFQGS